MVNATANALATIPAPKYFAARLSRITPSTRLTSVRPLISRACLTNPAGLAGAAAGISAATTPATFATFWDIRFPVLLDQFCLQPFRRLPDIFTGNDGRGYRDGFYTTSQHFIDIALVNSRNRHGRNFDFLGHLPGKFQARQNVFVLGFTAKNRPYPDVIRPIQNRLLRLLQIVRADAQNHS